MYSNWWDKLRLILSYIPFDKLNKKNKNNADDLDSESETGFSKFLSVLISVLTFMIFVPSTLFPNFMDRVFHGWDTVEVVEEIKGQ